MRVAWFIQFAATLALQADDQTILSDPRQNPVDPSQDFLINLRNPSTLLVTHPDANYTNLLNFLQDNGHRVARTSSSETSIVSKDGRWIYDTIILVGNVLPRSSDRPGSLTGRRVVDFFDEAWRLPESAEASSQIGPRLPPSLVVFNDPCQIGEGCSRTCSPDRTMRLVAEQLGIGFGVDHLEVVSSNCSSKIDTLDVNFEGSSHLLEVDNNFTHPYFPSTKQDSDPKRMSSTVTLISGARNWSRAVWINSESMCGDSSFSKNEKHCAKLLDWVTHRRDVVAWSNWQHFKIGGTREWEEYGGETVRSQWSLRDLQDSLQLTRPYLYRIRDEILVAIDLWEIQRDAKTNTFKWAPHTEPSLELEYVMMVPWIRKLLVPFHPKQKQPTKLMEAIAKNYRQLGDTLPLKLRESTSWIHFKAPKQHGIFKLVVKSFGGLLPQTPIWIETVMPLRTYKHDEHPRFVPAGAPFYLSLLTSTTTFLCFCAIFLYLPSSGKKLD